MTAPSRGGRTSGATRLALAVLAALLLVLTTACSDAPTEKEIAMADDGIDPSIVPIFTSEELLPTVSELGTLFLVSHPGVTFQYTAKDGPTLTQRMHDTVAPALWIDRSDVLAPVVSDPMAVGDPAKVGDDVMEFVIWKAFPGKLPTLEVFGPGTFPAKSGLCEATVPCGKAAQQILTQAGITPEPDFTLPTGIDVVKAMGTEQFQTGLVYRSEVAGLFTKFGVLPLPDPTIGAVTFESLRLRDDPIGEQFQQWIASSPEAEAVLVKHGLRPRTKAKVS